VKLSTFLKPLSFLPALLLMYMIYSFSAQEADISSAQSMAVSRLIVRGVEHVADRDWDDWKIDELASKIEGPVRKCAHMGEYFLLAVAVAFPFYVYGVRGLLLVLLAGVICVLYACGDEYHQSMVSGRSPSMRDVGIDSIGVLAGIILVRIIGWTGRMAVRTPQLEDEVRDLRAQLAERERELDERERELDRRRDEQDRGHGGFYAERSDGEESRGSYRSSRDDYRDDYRGDSDGGSRRARNEAPTEEELLEEAQRLYEEEHPSDELSEDMPLSRIFRRRRD